MVTPTGISRMVRQSRTDNPKTILGFFGAVLALIFATDGGIVTTLAVTNTYTDAIPFVLGFGGFAAVAIPAAVFGLAVKAPQKLMLAQVSGSEYAEIQHVRLGDSLRGEREVPVQQVGLAAPQMILDVETSPVAQIESASSGADEEVEQ